MGSTRFRYTLPVLLTIVFAFRLVLALAYPNMLWPDEIFQTLEQAHRLAFGFGVVPWEYQEGVRNWLFPGFLSGLIYLGSLIGSGSWGYILLVNSFLCLLSLIPVVAVYRFCEARFGEKEAVIAAAVLGFLVYFVHMAPKALFEVVSAHCFIAALFLLQSPARATRGWRFCAGALFGLCIALRLHYTPAVAVVLLWQTYHERRALRQLFPFFAGLVGVFLFSGLLDAYTWGTPFQSYWLYVKRNIIDGVSHTFGVDPWYAYLQRYGDEFRITLAFLLYTAFFGARRNPLAAAIFVMVLASHSAIAHKEMRFIYLATLLLCMLACEGLGALLFTFRSQARRTRMLTGLALLSVLFLGYAHHKRFLRFSAHMQAYRFLSRDTEMCHLGNSLEWSLTGGYYALHRHIPISSLPRATTPDDLAKINRLLIEQEAFHSEEYAGFVPIRCFDKVCVYGRKGGC